MATASITIKTDEEIKREASEILGTLGMDMTTGINVFLRTLVREKGFPFALSLEPDAEYKAWMKQELAKSREERNRPDTKWFTQEEMNAKYGL